MYLHSMVEHGLQRARLCRLWAHCPTVTITFTRTVRDGSSYASALTPIPQEWLVERDWYIVHH